MKIKKGFVLRDVCGDQVIMGEGLEAVNFKRLLTLNETAAFLWNVAIKLDGFTPEDLMTALFLEYEVSEEQASHDVDAIIRKWQDYDLLEN